MRINHPREGRSSDANSPRNVSLNDRNQHLGHSDGGTPDGKAIFKGSCAQPPSNSDRSTCIKYFHHLEHKLKKWCQSKSVDHVDKTLEIWDVILPYIENFLKSASLIFELDTKYYLSKEIDSRVWKYGIYHFIAIFKSDDPTQGTIRSGPMKEIIKMGICHFEDLLKVGVPNVLSIELEPIFSRMGMLRSSETRRASSATEDMIYRVFIYMGDLYRYRYQLDKDHHGAQMAKSMYIGARFCDTGKSRAYYQIGLIARTQADFIGTIYNFTRAWHNKNPADGALQQLQLIYGDVSRWYAKAKWTFWYTRVKVADSIFTQKWNVKDHIWLVETDATKIRKMLPNPVIPPTRLDHLQSLSVTEVYSRFSLAYAHFLGMIYTNIGTEQLEHVSRELLVYFEGLLLKNFDKFYFLMEVIGMILFLVDRLKPPEPTKDNAPLIAQRTHMRSVAIDTSLDMFMIVKERLMKILERHDWENPMLVPCTSIIYVWCNWAIRRKSLISMLRKQLLASWGVFMAEDRSCRVNFLISCIQLTTLLEKLVKHHDNLLLPKLDLRHKTNTQQLSVLPDHLALDGFAKVMMYDEIGASEYNFTIDSQQEMAQLKYRFCKIIQFGRTVFGDGKYSKLPDSFRQYDDPIDSIYRKEFGVMNVVYQRKETLQNCHSKKPDSNNARVIIKPEKTISKEESPPPEHVLTMEKRPMTDVQEIFSQLAMMGVLTEIVINPLRVVLDTNTFIRYLNWIEALMYAVPYPLIVPTTVLMELRGLAKGAKSGESPRISQKQLSLEEQKLRIEEIMRVGQQCVTALEFLDEHKRYFKVVTVEGKDVKMYKYKTQKVFDKRFGPNVRNDEKILETCCQLEHFDEAIRAQDHPLRIFRNTVLLTGDKSLRVRAFAQDIPAQDVQSFTEWIINYNCPGTIPTPSPKPRKRRPSSNSRYSFHT